MSRFTERDRSCSGACWILPAVFQGLFGAEGKEFLSDRRKCTDPIPPLCKHYLMPFQYAGLYVPCWLPHRLVRPAHLTRSQTLRIIFFLTPVRLT